MGKVAALAGIGAGGSVLAVGGTYATGNLFSNSKSREKNDSISETPEKVDEITNDESEEEDCWLGFFPGFDVNNWEVQEQHKKSKEIDKYKRTSNKLEASFFKPTGTETPQSCLIIKGKKDNYDQNKGTGDFSGLWAFSRGNHGFIWYSTLQTTDKDNIPLELLGRIYFLKKQGEEGILHRYKEWKSTTTFPEKVTKQNFKNKFPAVGTAITKEDGFGSDDNHKNHWGFVSGDGDLDNICKISDSTQCSAATSKDSFGGVWKGEPEASDKEQSESQKLTDGSSNSKIGISDLYNDASIMGTVSSYLDQIKGKGAKESLNSAKGNNSKAN